METCECACKMRTAFHWERTCWYVNWYYIQIKYVHIMYLHVCMYLYAREYKFIYFFSLFFFSLKMLIRLKSLQILKFKCNVTSDRKIWLVLLFFFYFLVKNLRFLAELRETLQNIETLLTQFTVTHKYYYVRFVCDVYKRRVRENVYFCRFILFIFLSNLKLIQNKLQNMTKK